MHGDTFKYWSSLCGHEIKHGRLDKDIDVELFPDISLFLWTKGDSSFAYSVSFSCLAFQDGGRGVWKCPVELL